MKTKAKGFFGGGDLKDETFAEDREKLEGWYHDHGYRDAKVTGFELKPGATPQALTLVIPGIVNNFIGLFKDTTLVQIVAIFDLLGQMIQHRRVDRSFAALTIPRRIPNAGDRRQPFFQFARKAVLPVARKKLQQTHHQRPGQPQKR